MSQQSPLDAGFTNAAFTETNLYTYPLNFEFSISTFTPQFTVKDAAGADVAFIKQKLFKMKEDVSVFLNSSESTLLYKINADRWLDWSAAYAFTEMSSQQKVGKVARQGMASLFSARYELFDENGQQDLIITEENPWVKVADALLSEIPILGIFCGYFFNPKYKIVRPDGSRVALFSKNASFFGRSFTLEQLSTFEKGEEKRILLGLMMMVLLERRRG